MQLRLLFVFVAENYMLKAHIFSGYSFVLAVFKCRTAARYIFTIGFVPAQVGDNTDQFNTNAPALRSSGTNPIGAFVWGRYRITSLSGEMENSCAAGIAFRDFLIEPCEVM